MSTIALLTDFGTADWYVGVMKGVMADKNQGAQIIDITHEIRPQHVQEAAFVLWNSYSFFPSGTIFTCVVDPGVGSRRNILAIKTRNYFYVAPENGLLNMVLAESEIEEAVIVNNPAYFRKNISSTFHGRDIFSPVTGYLSTGVPLSELGIPIEPNVPESVFIDVEGNGRYKGKIIYIDRFGNLVTNLRIPPGLDGEVAIGDHWIDHLVNNYSDEGIGKMLALRGSNGLLEISVRAGNAEDILKTDYAMPVYLQV